MSTLIPNKFTIVVVGNGTLAVKGLAILLKDFAGEVAVPLVVCDENDNGVDSDYRMNDDFPFRMSLKKAAVAFGFREGEGIISGRANSKRVRERIANCHPHVILSLQCRDVLCQPFLSIATISTLNMHNAPLPLLRGCDPFAWAIHDNLNFFGVTLHCVDLGIDSGDVVAQEIFPITNQDTAWSLFQKSLPCCDRLLRECLLPYIRGEIKTVPQDNRFVTYHPMNQFDFGSTLIDFDTVAMTLSCWIRARIFPPFQFPYFIMIDKTREAERNVKVAECYAVKDSNKSYPGRIRCTKEALEICARWGTIVLLTVIVDGKFFSGVDFAKEYSLDVNQSIYVPNSSYNSR